MATEALLSWFDRGKVVNLQSAYISGISLTLLIKPQGGALWPFVFGGFLAISSKYVLRYRDNHLWNPTNFAIGALLLAAPDTRLGAEPPVRATTSSTNLVIWTFGLIIAARVGVLHITLTYVASFLVLNSAARAGARPAAAARDRADHRADVSAVHLLHDHRSAHGREGTAAGRWSWRCSSRWPRRIFRLMSDRGVPMPTAFNAAPALLALAIVGPLAKWLDLRRAPTPAPATARSPS